MRTCSMRAQALLDFADGEVVFLEELTVGWSHLGGEESTM